MGWGPNLQKEVPHAEQPKARWRGGQQLQEDRLVVLPAEDGALPNGAVPQLDKEPTHPAMLVVPVPNVGRRVPGVEEDDAVSAVSELEVREWLEEQRAGAQEQDAGGELPLFLPTPDFMAAAGEE